MIIVIKAGGVIGEWITEGHHSRSGEKLILIFIVACSIILNKDHIGSLLDA